MKKDLDKILSRTLLTYTFLLFVVLILKIAGFDYFGLDINNPVIKLIDKFATRFHLINIWYCFTLTLYSYIIICITCNNRNKRNLLVAFTISIINLTINYFLGNNYSLLLKFIIDFGLIIFACIICNKESQFKSIIIRFIIIVLLNLLYQYISIIIRNVNKFPNNNFYLIVMNVDYILMMLITYKLYFLERRNNLWVVVVGLFSGLPTLLKKQLKRFPTRFSKTKNKIKSASNKEKFETSLYLFLFLLWNIFTVFVVLFVAKLNNGLPECIFILLSFWMNKTVFGKAFHMKKASYCFIVSNLVYYVLVRICISINISLLFPIILGVLLSYFTSLLVKYNEFKLYRGMPKDDLIAHCKICNLNKYDTQLMIDYYCERKTDVQIAMKNNYSVEAIKKQKKKVRDILNNH